MAVLASDQSCGEIRSWTGPSAYWRKAAVTRWAPERTKIGSVRMFTPFGSETCIQRSSSSTPTRSPSTEISSCSGAWSVFRALRPLPTSVPVVSWWNETRKTYSPSAGKLCSTLMPPRVPYGAPSTRWVCEAQRETWYWVSLAVAPASPRASRAIPLAAFR